MKIRVKMIDESIHLIPAPTFVKISTEKFDYEFDAENITEVVMIYPAKGLEPEERDIR